MSAPYRTILFAAAILTCAAGNAGAAEGQGATPSAASRKEGAGSTTSVGAGGLSGTGAVKDGARTGKAPTGDPKPPAAPAAGTAR
ncbi:hypothetical protein [Methylobacterium sp. J-070]|uniref:hypothetical protein n=1 Tax=Methylobacterium sp. J-070 TaxID=2836650 RepID=UPI001FBA2C34|nr:hypothetical protein [Methylobacterium sp. J-070]MCJ2052574.1 hypothetical protein [Methylobacterium sp. J-070]